MIVGGLYARFKPSRFYIRKKSRDFSATIITTERAAEKKKRYVCDSQIASAIWVSSAEDFDETIQKRSRGFRTRRARILWILLCGDGQRSADRTKCDAWRKNSRTPAFCQRKECLTAAAGASNDAGASVQPRPPGAPCAPHTAHCAAPGPQRNAPDNPALPPLPAAPVAASWASAESTPQRGGAPHSSGRSRTSSAPRLAAGRVQREQHRRPSLHRRDPSAELRQPSCFRWLAGSAPMSASARPCSLREVAAALLRIAGLHTEGMQLTSWKKTAERLDSGCVREQSSDSEAARPCELG